MKNNTCYILSDMIGGMIPKGFVLKYSKGDEVIISKSHFTWSETDCVYWNDDVDGWGYDYQDIFTPYLTFGKRVDFIFDERRTKHV